MPSSLGFAEKKSALQKLNRTLTQTVNYAGETDWKEGCVVVDLGVLLTSLQYFQCALPFDSSRCMGIHRVDSWVYIICTN